MLSRTKFWFNNNQLLITRATTMASVVINYSNAINSISVPYSIHNILLMGYFKA